MVGVAGVRVRVRFAVAVRAGEVESVTLKVRGVATTAAVGVPLMRPVVAFSDKPFGSVPAVNVHVKAPDPPVAVSVWEYATPTCPLGRGVVGMIGVAGIIVRVRFALAVSPGELQAVPLNVSGALLTATPTLPLPSPVLPFHPHP